jgi:predicted PhzF superfamily epimerase YddE/YHI9
MRTSIAPSNEGLPFTVVDAFTTQPFRGNPAAVMIFPDPARSGEYPVKDEVLQAIAMQFNIAESAFLVPVASEDERDEGEEANSATSATAAAAIQSYRLRWFSPLQEIRLCGHATLASAFTLFESVTKYHLDLDELRFHTTWSGTITARRMDDRSVRIELPAGTPVRAPASLRAAMTDAVLRASPSLTEQHIVDILHEKIHPAFKEYAVVVLDSSIDLRELVVIPAELVRL